MLWRQSMQRQSTNLSYHYLFTNTCVIVFKRPCTRISRKACKSALNILIIFVYILTYVSTVSVLAEFLSQLNAINFLQKIKNNFCKTLSPWVYWILTLELIQVRIIEKYKLEFLVTSIYRYGSLKSK